MNSEPKRSEGPEEVRRGQCLRDKGDAEVRKKQSQGLCVN